MENAMVLSAGSRRNGLGLKVVVSPNAERNSGKKCRQARWLLAPIFATAITFLVMGIVLG
ncbi:hypothetical protein EOB49_35470 [Mesorhizobium sp. M7A.F.Ca.MR.148.00.0.0]|nr:hypothetical protein EOB49_35470 [Mesorhizobium sp. M7A.F.Ca.MR.148.00.0.0]